MTITNRKNNRTKVFTMPELDQQIEIQTLHFNFSEAIITELSYFAEIHRNDKRKDFKESWEKWITTNSIAQIIQTEIDYQYKKGFVGDVIDKMFKSVRYYFRKKLIKNAEKNVEKKQRKPYISLCPQFLAEIDNHALEIIKKYSTRTDNKTTADISPASAYTNFCETNQTCLYEQIERLVDLLEYPDISEKMKKTYKNRFHLMKLTVENMRIQ